MAKSAVKDPETLEEVEDLDDVASVEDEARMELEDPEFLNFDDILIEGLEIEFEAPPVHATRAPATPRVNWATKLGALGKHPGKHLRIFSFSVTDYGDENARKMAQDKVAEIRKSLLTEFPNEVWDVKKDKVKASKEEPGDWRVYVAFLRDATEEEMIQRRKDHEAKVARAQHAAATRAANLAAEKANEAASA